MTTTHEARAWMKTFAKGWQRCFFGQTGSLECPICRDHVGKFFIICLQGHHVCDSCVNELDDREETLCPHCRGEMIAPIRDRTHERWRESVVLSCPTRTCAWRGCFDEWKAHMCETAGGHGLDEWSSLRSGQYLDVMDADGVFAMAQIRTVDTTEMTLTYPGWDETKNETVPRAQYPARFAPPHTWTTPMHELLRLGGRVAFRSMNCAREDGFFPAPLPFHPAFTRRAAWRGGRVQYVSPPLVHLRIHADPVVSDEESPEERATMVDMLVAQSDLWHMIGAEATHLAKRTSSS